MADTYTVTSQRATTVYNKAGKLVPVIEVSFTTKPNDIAGKVDVPQAGYSKATAVPLITAAAAALEEVHNS